MWFCFGRRQQPLELGYIRAYCLLKAGFLIIAEYILHYHIDSVDPLHQGSILIHANTDIDSPRLHATGRLYAFPDRLDLDDNIKASVLCSMMCEHALHGLTSWSSGCSKVISTHCFVKKSLIDQDICTNMSTDITQARFVPKGFSLHAQVAPKYDPTGVTHAVHKVVLATGKVYCLDLTAAQYGWYDEVPLKWSSFKKKRCSETPQEFPFDSSFVCNEYKKDSMPYDVAEHRFQRRLLETFKANIHTFMHDRPDFSKSLATISNQEFEQEKALFLAEVSRSIKAAVDEADPQWVDIRTKAGKEFLEARTAPQVPPKQPGE